MSSLKPLNEQHVVISSDQQLWVVFVNKKNPLTGVLCADSHCLLSPLKLQFIVNPRQSLDNFPASLRPPPGTSTLRFSLTVIQFGKTFLNFS